MTADLTNTERDAGLAEQARTYPELNVDYDDGVTIAHEPCLKRGCLVCDILPRVVARRGGAS